MWNSFHSCFFLTGYLNWLHRCVSWLDGCNDWNIHEWVILAFSKSNLHSTWQILLFPKSFLILIYFIYILLREYLDCLPTHRYCFLEDILNKWILTGWSFPRAIFPQWNSVPPSNEIREPSSLRSNASARASHFLISFPSFSCFKFSRWTSNAEWVLI